MTPDEAAGRYARYFETLTPASAGDIRAFAAPDIRFKDPFNDLVGIDAYIRVYDKMFADVDDACFAILDRAISGQVAYLRWRMTFQFRGAPWVLEGVAEVEFDAEGRVLRHIDHWDSGSQFYRRLPVIGWLIRLIERRLRA